MGKGSYLGGSTIWGWSDFTGFGKDRESGSRAKSKTKPAPTLFQSPRRNEQKAGNEPPRTKQQIKIEIAKRDAAIKAGGFAPLPAKLGPRSKALKALVRAGVLLPNGRINHAYSNDQKASKKKSDD